MGTISRVLSGTAVLIGMYLILKNSGSTVKVINSLGGVYTSSVKTLQGRQEGFYHGFKSEYERTRPWGSD